MKVSIITAVYNRVSTIEQAIQSVISQDHADIEYIVIDGGSTDGTLEVIERYKQHISIFKSERDKGIYDALNKGIALATGHVIGFLHSDDLFENNTVVGKIVDTFEKCNVDSVYGDLVYVNHDNPDSVIRYWKSGEYKYSNIKWGWSPPHPSFYIKKEVYDKYGYFDTALQIAADYDITLRFLHRQRITASYLPHTIVRMRVGGASNTIKNIVKKMREDCVAMRRNGLWCAFTLSMKNVRKIPQFFKKNS